MKEKIIIFIIGLLAGAVLSTGAFTVFTLLTNNCHKGVMNTNNMPMIKDNNNQQMNNNNQPPQMNNNNGNNSNNNQPPEMPNNNQQEQNNQ